MKKIYLLLTAIAFTSHFFAQEIKWSELESSKGMSSDIIPFGGDDFVTVRHTRSSSYLAFYSDLAEVALGEINYRVEKGKGVLESINRIGDEIVVFISDRDGKTKTLYYQKYSKSCVPTTEPRPLITYDFTSKFNTGSFRTYISENSKYMLLKYSITGRKKSDVDQLGYKVVNENMEVISEGELINEYNGVELSLGNTFISNKGDFFMIGNEMTSVKRGLFNYPQIARSYIMKVDGDKLDAMEFELPDGKYVSQLKISEDKKGNLQLTGMYGNGSSQTGGIYYYLIDFDRKNIKTSTFNEFEKDFIESEFSLREKKKAEKKEKKGKGPSQFYNYTFADLIKAEDGSLIGIMEQFYIVVHTYTDPKTGATRTTYTYYYNDLVVYKINSEGEFVYTKKIPKRQVSSNDSGYYSSYGMYVGKEDIHIFFNDNIRNYDEGGNCIIEPGKIARYNISPKSNVVAEVVMSVETGEYSRKPMFSRKEVEAIAVPKHFTVDYDTDVMLLYLRRGKREKFGSLKF